MGRLDVLYQSSSAYAIPAAVSICSLLENNRNIGELNIWFIDGGLTEEDREHLHELVDRYGRSLRFISGSETDRLLKEAGIELWSGSYATFYKIFICSQIPDIDALLYIDADTLVLDSLEELCGFEFGGHACAMVGSGMTATVKDYLDLPDYFNAGVIYYNLLYWREHRVFDMFMSVIHGPDREKYTLIGDETLTNYVLKGKIKKLPLKYNFELSWWLWGWNKRIYPKLGWKNEADAYYRPDEIKAAGNRPCIAHYVDLTTGRPWDYLNDSPFRVQYEHYRAILHPWKEMTFAMRGIGGNNKFVVRAKALVKKMLPFPVRSRLGFYQHDSAWKQKIDQLGERHV